MLEADAERVHQHALRGGRAAAAQRSMLVGGHSAGERMSDVRPSARPAASTGRVGLGLASTVNNNTRNGVAASRLGWTIPVKPSGRVPISAVDEPAEGTRAAAVWSKKEAGRGARPHLRERRAVHKGVEQGKGKASIALVRVPLDACGAQGGKGQSAGGRHGRAGGPGGGSGGERGQQTSNSSRQQGCGVPPGLETA